MSGDVFRLLKLCDEKHPFLRRALSATRLDWPAVTWQPVYVGMLAACARRLDGYDFDRAQTYVGVHHQ